MPPQLLALTEGPNLLLDKPILLLGRHQECDIQIPSRKISRRHCCIAQINDHLLIRDLGSTNGIRINGEKVLEGQLKPGDELTIGNFRYKVRLSDQEEEGGRPAVAERVPVANVGGDKDPFDSVDEPVALEERGGSKSKGPFPPVLPSEGVAPPPAPPGPRPSEKFPSLHLPDHIELAPSSSGDFPPVPAPR
jgi:pSer/pThr/pTyr-binding forkhead associated (FHA) protein